LRSNDPPAESEVPVITNTVSAGQKHIDMLDVQIDALQASLSRLVEERTKTEELVRQHTAVLSSLRCVPPELVCEILALVSCIRRLGKQTVPRLPWRLTHSCRTWRLAFLGDPRLWTSLH
ncbi:hypothetical protein C8R44DRAFT_556530, partial [Mycena epipterygia]